MTIEIYIGTELENLMGVSDSILTRILHCELENIVGSSDWGQRQSGGNYKGKGNGPASLDTAGDMNRNYIRIGHGGGIRIRSSAMAVSTADTRLNKGN